MTSTVRGTGRIGARAIVLGGSMAGLLAARVLSESFGEVVIVDRDKLVGVREARRGVPQGRHVHGLLARGQQILDELFPGFTERVAATGVPTGDLGELRWFFNGKRLAPSTTGCVCVSADRPVLEFHVRSRVEELAGVSFLEGHDILGYTTTPDHRRVTGARVAPHGRAGEETALAADLVVDATGRGSRTPVWLEQLGYQRPPEDRIKIDLSYTTRHYRLPDESILGGDLSINPVATPSHRRGAFFSRIDGGRSIVSLTGVLGDRAPTDPDGFIDWMRTLPVPDVFDVIRDAEPLDDPVSFHYPESVRRRYEKLRRFPDRLIVLGDAACSFNPVYGQGMTVAALESMALRGQLRRGFPVASRWFAEISKIIDLAWDISAGGDLGFPEVRASRSLKVRLGNAYLTKMQAAATADGAVTRTFMRVAGLVDPPSALMKPGMIARVLRTARRLNRQPVQAPVRQATRV